MADPEKTPAAIMGAAIIKGIIIGLPVVIVGLTFGVMAITDLDIVNSFATAILPGILLGAFGGGFAGMAATMQE